MLKKTDSRKILLVEDDKVTQRIHIYFLKKLGFEIDLVSTGKEALECTIDTNYFAMILDLGLPDMDGEVVLSTIRERETHEGGHLPIIVVTAHDPTILDQYKFQKKANDCFIKPVKFLYFKQALQQLQQLTDA
jgi:CheY-like chemotaxis protein